MEIVFVELGLSAILSGQVKSTYEWGKKHSLCQIVMENWRIEKENKGNHKKAALSVEFLLTLGFISNLKNLGYELAGLACLYFSSSNF